ncbi:MAG: hypothetical protein L6R39_002086 [Caloplaca ligustica]|nr:MAG: hypothetical protein L6R39_002086 [Caloplaca ligustica]
MAEDAAMQDQQGPPEPPSIAEQPPPPVQEQQQVEQFPVQSSADSPAPPLTNIHADIDMADAVPSPALPPSAATPTAQRTATPSRNTNGNIEAPPPLPAKAAVHGAPARRYLNEKVTGVLLEGMKRLAVEQPDDPLRVLGEYLLQRSKDIEGS